MDSPIAFSGTPERETLFRAVRLATLPSRWSMIVRGLLAALIIVVYAALIIQALAGAQRAAPDLLQVGMRVFTLPVLVYLILRPFIEPYFAARRIWDLPASRQPLAGTVDGEGLAVHAQGGTRIIPWERIARARADESLLALVTKEGEVIVLPRDYFGTSGDWERAAALSRKQTTTRAPAAQR